MTAASIAGACLAGLGELGGKAEAETLHAWLAARPRPRRPLSLRQVRSGLHRLSIMHPPLAVCAERSGTGKGRPGIWHLTGEGRERTGLAGGQVRCGTGWPAL